MCNQAEEEKMISNSQSPLQVLLGNISMVYFGQGEPCQPCLPGFTTVK